MTTTAVAPKMGAGAAMTQGSNTHAEPLMLLKRIGSTTFRVNVRFSSTSKETMEDKILRIVEREVKQNA